MVGTTARHITTGQFASFLSEVLDAPVEDETRLSGTYAHCIRHVRGVSLARRRRCGNSRSPIFRHRHHGQPRPQPASADRIRLGCGIASTRNPSRG
ncbi:MAG: DUF3738 domain-containing protein [Terriglobales bacterium]